MIKRVLFFIHLIILSIGITGCLGQEETEKEMMIKALEKSKEVNNYTFQGTLKISSDLTSSISDIHFKVTGQESVVPYLLEANTEIKAGSKEMKTTIEIPIQIKNDTLYVKVPSIFFMNLPDQTKKFISIELEKGNQQSEKIETIDFLIDILNSLEDEAFIEEDVQNYSLEKGELKHVIQLTVNQAQFVNIMKTIIEEDAEYVLKKLERTAITEEQKNYVKEIEEKISKEDVAQIIRDLENRFTIRHFEMIQLIDQDNHVRKNVVDANILIDTEDKGKIDVKIMFEEKMNNINHAMPFTIPTPTEEETINLEEFIQNAPIYLNM